MSGAGDGASGADVGAWDVDDDAGFGASASCAFASARMPASDTGAAGSPVTQFGARRKQAMVAHEIGERWRDDGREPAKKLVRLKGEHRRAVFVRPRLFQLEAHLAALGQAELVLRKRAAESVAT